MNDKKARRVSESIIARARAFGADLAGIANVDDVKQSPSHLISEKIPEYAGVGTTSAAGRRRGIVHWPQGAGSAIVMAMAHPPEKPELDWWITGASTGNTAGNQLLMSVVDKLADWLEQDLRIRSFKLPYHIEHGGVYMKDAAVTAGLGCVGKNNLLVTPRYGPRQRLRVMLIEPDLPSTGPMDFDPCFKCPKPCRKACPQHAFSKTVFTRADCGIDALPGRSGVFSRLQCNRQMEIDLAGWEAIAIQGQESVGRRVKYCRECELACPVGAT
jgi:epoxyqueuosine reductase